LWQPEFAFDKSIQTQVHRRFDLDTRAIRNRGIPMRKRSLGNSGLEVAPLAFGGNVFGWTVDERTSFKLLDAFVAAGFNLIDTADVYSRFAPGNRGGESERIIGKWLKQGGRRDKVIIATKVGLEMDPHRKGLSKAYILRAAEDSLRRLQTSYIDLYQSHRDDAGTSLDETLQAYAQLMEQGKVRAIGASNYSAERLSHALALSRRHGLPRYECLQMEYNLYDRAEYEETLEPVCIENGLGVLSYFSLASGFLTGKYKSAADVANKARGDFVKKYLNERGFKIVDALDQVAKQLHATPAQIALVWLMARRTVTAPIASATNLAQLKELIGATKLELDEASMRLLNGASDGLR
jgi:aryl-alcohol dehydrogenase-like predicted oxidoreductase